MSVCVWPLIFLLVLFCGGDLYFDKAVNCFLTELFQKWKVGVMLVESGGGGVWSEGVGVVGCGV